VKGDSTDHQTTAVAEGTLLFASGVTTFGNRLVVTNGAAVSTVGASTGFAVDEITLGDAASAGILNLDAGDTVTVATAAGLHFVNAQINHPNAATDGTYDVFVITSGVPTDEQLKGLDVYTKTLGKRYKFAAVADGDGAKVQLTVSTATVQDDVWTGAVSGAWRTGGNWASGEYADELTVATFPASAVTKAVTIADADQANRIVLEDSYTFTGAGSLATGGIDAHAGESAIDVALNVASDVPIASATDTRLDLRGDMSGTEAVTVSKHGWGEVTVSGDNAAYQGAWTTDGGYLTFDGDTAAGAAAETVATWQLNGGTVVFTNGTQTIGRAMTMDPGTTTGMVICAEGDTTIIGGLTSLSGGYVQRGSGKLTLKYGLGTKTLAKDLLGNRSGQMPVSGAITFPENGASPAVNTLSAFNLLSGTLRLEGQGQNNTTWYNQNHCYIVGGNWADAPASARLEVTQGTLDIQGYDWQTVIGNYISSPNATHPTLYVGPGGYVSTTESHFGLQKSGFESDVYPTLALTNGTFASYFSTHFGGASATSKLHPILRIGAGGNLHHRSSTSRSFYYAVQIGHDIDAEVADGGVITGADKGWGLHLKAGASGEMRFLNGGKLSVPFISSLDAATTTDSLKFVFDGGIYAPTIAHTTSVHAASLRYFELRNAGMTFSADVRHTMAMRLTGTGDFVKKGTGVLTFAKDNECVSRVRADDDKLTLGDSGYKTLDFTGTLHVEAGSVVIEPGAARAGLKVDVASGKSVDFGGGTMDAYVVSGAGTVKNAVGGALTVAAADGATPVLDGLKLGVLKVDFAAYGNTLKKGDVVTVAKLANGATVGRFRAVNVGDGLSATFEVDGEGNVVATVCNKNGFSMVIR